MKILTDEIREHNPLLCIPDTSDGFDKSEESYAHGFEAVTYFEEVKPGDYKLQIQLRAREDIPQLYIFAGRKALMWKGGLKKGELLRKCVYTNVSQIIPRYHEEPYIMEHVCVTIAADSWKDVEVLGIEAQQIVDNSVTHLWLCGDSTVTDQSSKLPYNPGACYSAWGQMLTDYLSEGYVVSNHAHCGLTTESFREEGHYGIVEKLVRPGDYVFFQFGHNDQKLSHLMPDTGYSENILRYIDEIRQLNAIPVLVTPLARNTWKSDNTYHDLLQEYADTVLAIGKEKQVPVIDLHAKAMELICQEGFEQAKRWFHPGDMTHTNDYGAYRMAGFVADEIKRIGLHDTAGMIRPEQNPIWEAPEGLWELLKNHADSNHATKEQKEQFDSLEKSVGNLIRIIEEAKSGR